MDGFGGGLNGMVLTSKTTIVMHEFAVTPQKNNEKASAEFQSKNERRQMFMFQMNRN